MFVQTVLRLLAPKRFDILNIVQHKDDPISDLGVRSAGHLLE